MRNHRHALPKYLADRIASLCYPTLLVHSSSYFKSYYLIENEAAIFAASLEVMKARIASQAIRKPSEKPEHIPEEITGRKLKVLPEPYKTMAIKANKERREMLAHHAEQVAQYKLTLHCIKNQDGVLAFDILSQSTNPCISFENLCVPRV